MPEYLSNRDGEGSQEIQFPEGYISLRNGSARGKFSLIRCDVGLPPYVGELGLKTRPMLNLARLAGFRSVRIVSRSDASSETTYGLQGGIGGDGTLRGSISTATTIIPEAYSDLLYDDNVQGAYVPRGRMWGDLTITLNTKELQKRIVDEGSAANDKKAWSKHINGAIIEEIVKKGAFNLLKSGDGRNNRDALIQGPVLQLVYEFLCNNDIATGQFDIKHYLIFSVLNLMWYSYVFRWNMRRGNGPSRFSVLGVHAPAVDRTAALFTSAKAKLLKPMIKPISTE